MTVTIPQVEASKPEGLTQTATALGQSASSLSSQIDTQRATIDGLRNKWQGPASDAAIAKAQPTLLKMQQIHDALGRAQSVLQQGGSALTQTRTNVLHTVSELKGQGWQVGPDGNVSVRPGSPIDRFAKISEPNAMKVQQLAATNSANVKALLASFDTTDRQLSQNVRTAVGGLQGGPLKLGPDGNPLPQAPSYDTGSEIPVGKDPTEVKKWWDSLPPDKQAQLLRDWPGKLGNLNGIPVANRDTANRTLLARDLDLPYEIAKSRGVTKEEVLAHPENYGLTGPTMDRYQNALKVQDALDKDAANARDANNRTPDILLMKYDPEAFGGKGAAAIAIGDPDHSANTSVTVSGLTTSVASGSLSDGTGANLYNEANKADVNNSTAVVQWMGYDAPNDQAVAEPNMARNGAHLLVSDVNGLAVTHDGSPSHTTVIGHSYGSTTVSDAAYYGMHADDVVLIGCPGTDLAQSAADFHLPPDGHLYVGAASTDIVTNLGSEHLNVPGTGLGKDPAMDGFGSTRFHAEVADWHINPIDEHTSYYQAGSESLFSMADIVSGHGDALEHDGMTANHRVQPGLPFPVPGLPQGPVIDPESLHFPTNDHRHTGLGG
ncbi:MULTISPECIES: alpha/beta hydrolase [unclassified Mycobacterium]|uniref:alpha/beta hydrolase n=1 Tax=unclassified Mycobacterium TaxID=2642494 RepID=UPI0029C8C797|nr:MULTISPECIES: alpha/beta hydrolase [unclassified Mycobacterium]